MPKTFLNTDKYTSFKETLFELHHDLVFADYMLDTTKKMVYKS